MSPRQREKFILRGMESVTIYAHQVHRRVNGHVRLEDLIGEGTLGLIEAVNRYEPKRHVSLMTYANHRIKGAMLDYLRREDPLTRQQRKDVNEGKASYMTFSLDQVPAGTSATTDERQTPETTTTHRINRDLVKQLLNRAALTPQERKVIAMNFLAGFTLRSIAQLLGVAESRVSVVRSNALTKLRSTGRHYAF